MQRQGSSEADPASIKWSQAHGTSTAEHELDAIRAELCLKTVTADTPGAPKRRGAAATRRVRAAVEQYDGYGEKVGVTMKLHELAFGCLIYKIISGDDSRVTQLRRATGGQLDPHNSEHQKFLFTWLRQWRCRQFDKAHEDIAARSLEDWASKWHTTLPTDDVMLEKIDQAQINVIGAAYEDLSWRQAGARKLAPYVRYGPVGAAKTLFALRPNICPPWDSFTQDELGFDDSGASYCKYLQLALSDLKAVSGQAEVQISELPALIDRSKSTPPKLIDEYYWVTITRGFAPPSREILEKWLAWSELE
jgi:hypothetical protein